MLLLKIIKRKNKNHNSISTHGKVTATRSHPHNPFKPAQAFLMNITPPHSSLTFPHFSPDKGESHCWVYLSFKEKPPNKFTLKVNPNSKNNK